MERLPADVVYKIREFSKQLETLGARSLVNYILYEFEIGGPSLEVLDEAERLAIKGIEELKQVVDLVNELKRLVA
ncbi:MAG: hypothetical protein ABWK05_03600 [Pyrobaculum sp.]